jgi:FRG domain
MHLGKSALPKDDLTWLALMQHYAIPTRLLDFTYSPFVGLYFAIQNNTSASGNIRLSAIDAQAVNGRFRKVA